MTVIVQNQPWGRQRRDAAARPGAVHKPQPPLGRRADGFGYRNWLVAPASGVGLGLKRASATVVTAFDGDLGVEWRKDGDVIGIVIRAPIGTQGQFVYGNESIALHGRTEYRFTVDASLHNGIV